MSAHRIVPFVLIALIAPALAGCLTPPGGETAPGATSTGANDAAMTAHEEVAEDAGMDVSVPPTYYAERVHTIGGTLALDRLPVTLSSVNGHVTVRPGVEGEWRLVATLRATGATAVDAEANLDSIVFAWAHEEEGRHFIEARVEMRDRSDGSRTAHLAVEVPPSLLVTELAATTTNGNVGVGTLRVLDLSALTTNGGVDVEASDVGSANLATTNGNVAASLRPGRSGSIQAQSTNGDVAVRVPEGERFGYRAEAAAVNGEATISLADGSTDGSGGYGMERKSFRTSGFENRDVRFSVSVGTTNGDATLSPL